mgnify:CR=1 FL=1
MYFLFKGCQKLTNLLIQNFHFQNVIDMSHLFSGCETAESFSLQNIDIIVYV